MGRLWIQRNGRMKSMTSPTAWRNMLERSMTSWRVLMNMCRKRRRKQGIRMQLSSIVAYWPLSDPVDFYILAVLSGNVFLLVAVAQVWHDSRQVLFASVLISVWAFLSPALCMVESRCLGHRPCTPSSVMSRGHLQLNGGDLVATACRP